MGKVNQDALHAILQDLKTSSLDGRIPKEVERLDVTSWSPKSINWKVWRWEGSLLICIDKGRYGVCASVVGVKFRVVVCMYLFHYRISSAPLQPQLLRYRQR